MIASCASRRIMSRFLPPPGGDGGSGTGHEVVVMDRLVLPPVGPAAVCNRGNSPVYMDVINPDEV